MRRRIVRPEVMARARAARTSGAQTTVAASVPAPDAMQPPQSFSDFVTECQELTPVSSEAYRTIVAVLQQVPRGDECVSDVQQFTDAAQTLRYVAEIAGHLRREVLLLARLHRLAAPVPTPVPAPDTGTPR